MDEDTRALREQIAALTAAVAALTAAHASAPVTLGDRSLGDLAELYEATIPDSKAWKLSVQAMHAPAIKHFGPRPARAITRQDWAFFRDKVWAESKTIRKRKPTPNTLNQGMCRWGIVYRWAIGEGLLRENPIDTLKPLEAKRHRETEPTWDDISALEPHCDPELWALVLLGFRRGFRRDEARRLEWRDVDLERGRIRLPSMRVKTREAASMRIPSDVIDALRAIKSEIPGRYVFQSPRGGPLSKTTLWRRWRAAVDKARAADATKLQAADGDGQIVFHDTRHGFASGMARKVPIQVTMRMTRHRSLTAASRYIHVNEDDLEGAYEKLENDARRPAKRSTETGGHISSRVSIHVGQGDRK